jgi:hypothetical protein
MNGNVCLQCRQTLPFITPSPAAGSGELKPSGGTCSWSLWHHCSKIHSRLRTAIAMYLVASRMAFEPDPFLQTEC